MSESGSWQLDLHGDNDEKRWWSRVRALFPAYEVFWRVYIVPQTFRILDPALILLRTGLPPDPRQLAEEAYQVFREIGAASEIVSTNTLLTKGRLLRDVFSCLYGATETLQCVFSTSRKICGAYGGPQISDRKRRCELGGDPALDADVQRTREIIGEYRGALQHTRSFVMVGDRIPTPEHVRKYQDLSRISLVTADTEALRLEFAPAAEIVAEILRDVATCANRSFNLVMRDFEVLPQRERLIADISTARATDRTLAPQLKNAPLSGWAPETSSVLTARMSVIGGTHFDELK